MSSTEDRIVRRRVVRGLGAATFFQASVLLVRLLEAPLFIGVVGATAYGEWLLLASFPMALAVADAGIGKAAQRQMTMRFAAGDSQGAKATFSASFAAIAAIGALIIVCVLATLDSVDIQRVYDFKAIPVAEVRYTVICLAIQSVVFLLSGLGLAGMASVGCLSRSILLQSIAMVVTFVCMAIGLVATDRVLIAAFVSLCCSILACSVYFAQAYKKMGGFQLMARRGALEEIRCLAKPALANVAFPVGEAVSTQGIRIIVGATLGPAALAQFATLRTLARVALQPILAVARVAETEMSIAFGAKDLDRVRSVYLSSIALSVVLSAFIGTSVWFVGGLAYEWWTHGELGFDEEVVLLLLAASFVGAVSAVALNVAAAENRHVKLSLTFFVLNAVVLPVAAYIGAAVGGQTGVAGGILLAEALFMAACVLSAKRVTGALTFGGVARAVGRMSVVSRL